MATNETLISSIPDHIPVYVVPQTTMDAIAGYHVHRGIMAIGKRIITNTLREIIDQAPADSLLVILSDISNHDNVGSIFRNAAAFSADAVVLDNRCCDPLYRKALRVSVGGVLNVPWVQGLPVAEILTILTESSFEIVALSPAGTKTISEIPKSGRRALLLGSEGHGLPSALLDSLCSYKIPMSPEFDSLNVATASGIALYAASRYSV